MDAGRPLPFPHSPPVLPPPPPLHDAIVPPPHLPAISPIGSAGRCHNCSSNSINITNGKTASAAASHTLEGLLRRARDKLRKAARNNKKMLPVRSVDADDATMTRVHANLVTELDQQRKQGMFVDLTLVVGGGSDRDGGEGGGNAAAATIATETAAPAAAAEPRRRSFPVHRNVVAAASPFFRAMLSVEMRESGQDVVELKDVDADAMEVVLDYIYTGKLKSVSWSSLLPLLLLANMLQMEHLERECRDILEELLHELHRWICTDSPSSRSSTSLSEDDLMFASIRKENDLRDSAIGRESLEFLLDVLFMFEQFPVVFAQEESSQSVPLSSPSSSSSSTTSSPSSPTPFTPPPFPAAKAMKNLCSKILRTPKVLKILADDSDELLQRIDTQAIEYLVKCPGAVCGSPAAILRIIVKKFVFGLAADAEDISDAGLQQHFQQHLKQLLPGNFNGIGSGYSDPNTNESTSEAIKENLQWFVEMIRVIPPTFRTHDFLRSFVFSKIQPHHFDTNSSVLDCKALLEYSLEAISHAGHQQQQQTQQQQQQQPPKHICHWTKDGRRMLISKRSSTEDVVPMEADKLFEIPHPNTLEMIHMESSMRLWSGCYKSSWLRIEELEPSVFIHLRGGGGGAFEILKVFLASLNDGKTLEIKIHICGFDPISSTWISISEEATLCYKHLETSTTASQASVQSSSSSVDDGFEITEMFGEASEDGRRLYVGVNVDGVGVGIGGGGGVGVGGASKNSQRSICHVLAFESASCSSISSNNIGCTCGNSSNSSNCSSVKSSHDPFHFTLKDKYTKRRHRLQGLVVTSNPKGDEVLLFGDAFSGSVRYPTTHSLLYWHQDGGDGDAIGGGGGVAGGVAGVGRGRGEGTMRVERSRQPRPETAEEQRVQGAVEMDVDGEIGGGFCVSGGSGVGGGGGKRSGPVFQAVEFGEFVYCLIFDASSGREAAAWKYTIVGDSWSKLRLPETSGNLAFINMFVDEGVFFALPRQGQQSQLGQQGQQTQHMQQIQQLQQTRQHLPQTERRLALIYAQRAPDDDQLGDQKKNSFLHDEAAFYGLVGDPNRREFGGFHLMHAGGGVGGDDWNPFPEKQKDSLFRFAASVSGQMEADMDMLKGKQQPTAQKQQQHEEDLFRERQSSLQQLKHRRSLCCIKAIGCLNAFHSFGIEETASNQKTSVWYFHDEAKSRLLMPQL